MPRHKGVSVDPIASTVSKWLSNQAYRESLCSELDALPEKYGVSQDRFCRLVSSERERRLHGKVQTGNSFRNTDLAQLKAFLAGTALAGTQKEVGKEPRNFPTTDINAVIFDIHRVLLQLRTSRMNALEKRSLIESYAKSFKIETKAKRAKLAEKSCRVVSKLDNHVSGRPAVKLLDADVKEFFKERLTKNSLAELIVERLSEGGCSPGNFEGPDDKYLEIVFSLAAFLDLHLELVITDTVARLVLSGNIFQHLDEMTKKIEVLVFEKQRQLATILENHWKSKNPDTVSE